MNTGKTLFAQLMDFLPRKTFHRIIDRHDGDYCIKSMTGTDQFRVLAFAQPTYRESLRDIEVCLSAQAAKLYHVVPACYQTLDAGRCQRNAGLAHSCRISPEPDRTGAHSTSATALVSS